MMDSRRVSLDEIVAHFQELEDPRSTINQRHPLASVLVIAILAVLAGAGGPTAIARWAAYKEEFLVQVLDLPNGVPRKDVFRRVLMTLEPAAFQACFVNWLRSLREEAVAQTGVEQPILPIDGKTLRRSHDRNNGLSALHSVSIWASEYGLSLGQVACAEKSNEITAIPELLRLVDIKGGIITIDAMGTQKAIAEQIIAGGADYVLALKGNQETLHQAVIDYIDEQLEGDLADAQEHVTKEKGHGREEDADVSATSGSQGTARVHGLEGTEVDWAGDLVLPAEREGDHRGSLLHQQLGRGREAVCPRGSWPLEHREHVPLEPGHDVSRGRDANPRAAVAGELRLVEPVRAYRCSSSIPAGRAW